MLLRLDVRQNWDFECRPRSTMRLFYTISWFPKCKNKESTFIKYTNCSYQNQITYSVYLINPTAPKSPHKGPQRLENSITSQPFFIYHLAFRKCSFQRPLFAFANFSSRSKLRAVLQIDSSLGNSTSFSIVNHVVSCVYIRWSHHKI